MESPRNIYTPKSGSPSIDIRIPQPDIQNNPTTYTAQLRTILIDEVKIMRYAIGYLDILNIHNDQIFNCILDRFCQNPQNNDNGFSSEGRIFSGWNICDEKHKLDMCEQKNMGSHQIGLQGNDAFKNLCLELSATVLSSDSVQNNKELDVIVQGLDLGTAKSNDSTSNRWDIFWQKIGQANSYEDQQLAKLKTFVLEGLYFAIKSNIVAAIAAVDTSKRFVTNDTPLTIKGSKIYGEHAKQLQKIIFKNATVIKKLLEYPHPDISKIGEYFESAAFNKSFCYELLKIGDNILKAIILEAFNLELDAKKSIRIEWDMLWQNAATNNPGDEKKIRLAKKAYLDKICQAISSTILKKSKAFNRAYSEQLHEIVFEHTQVMNGLVEYLEKNLQRIAFQHDLSEKRAPSQITLQELREICMSEYFKNEAFKKSLCKELIDTGNDNLKTIILDAFNLELEAERFKGSNLLNAPTVELGSERLNEPSLLDAPDLELGAQEKEETRRFKAFISKLEAGESNESNQTEWDILWQKVAKDNHYNNDELGLVQGAYLNEIYVAISSTISKKSDTSRLDEIKDTASGILGSSKKMDSPRSNNSNNADASNKPQKTLNRSKTAPNGKSPSLVLSGIPKGSLSASNNSDNSESKSTPHTPTSSDRIENKSGKGRSTSPNSSSKRINAHPVPSIPIPSEPSIHLPSESPENRSGDSRSVSPIKKLSPRFPSLPQGWKLNNSKSESSPQSPNNTNATHIKEPKEPKEPEGLLKRKSGSRHLIPIQLEKPTTNSNKPETQPNNSNTNTTNDKRPSSNLHGTS